ncbi:hypothetical protein [Fournierella sp.]|uniref:hypothetical protein n=1 Tax=Allofournierella sp. TaxID=1940256 RepID=UPI0025BC7506|nr:hypothetical protein [Fournierella sp.]
MASKYTEDYIQGILDQNKQKSEPRSAQEVQGASKYTTEYIQGVLNRSSEKNQSTMQGPLRTKNTSGGQTAAASTAQKEPEKKSFLQSIQEGWQSTPIGKAMLESKPEKNSSLEKPSNTGVLDSLTKNGLYRQSDALKQRLQANANEGNPLAQLAQYAADQTVNTVKGVGSILTGNPYDYYSEYAEDWKKANDQKYTPFEMAANTVGRNVYAGLGQLQGGLASTADMLLPDQITPEPVQESLDWLKQSTENVNNWANEFNQETGQTVLPQVLQAAGGMAPDLALAFATGGASLAGKAPQLAAASTGKLQAVRQIVQQAVENPQFWLSFTRTWGNDYEEAKARGASEEQAVAASALSSLLNAQIEVGGGVQTQFADDAKKGLKGILQNALEEGSEEVKQNLVTNAANKLVFDRTAPIVSTSDETAVLNPGREATSFAVGALAGGMMGTPGALRRGNGIMDLFPAVDEQTQNTYNQGKGVIENGGQANPDLGGNVPVDGGAVYSGRSSAEYEPGGNGQRVSGAASAGGQGTAQTNAARAQAVTGKDLRSSTTRQLRDLYTKWYAGQITPEEMEFESTRIAKSLVDPKEFSIQPDDSALARAEYLKSTPIYVNQDEKQILLNQFGTKTIPQLNIKLGTKFTENPNGAIGLDVAVQEMAGSGLGVTETGSAVDDISKAVGRPRAEIDEDMVNAQVEYLRDKIYSGGENKQTFDEWLAVASEDSEWGAPAEYVQRIAERYGIGQSADTGIDPNLQSLFDSAPMAAPKDSSPIDMQALYDTDLSGTTNTSAQPVDAPDEYGIASLFRSDPQGPGLSDQAQIDAQTSMREYQEMAPNILTEEQKQLAGLTGDLVKDTFARHPITQRVNYGQEAAEIRQAEANKKALQKEWDQYRRASSSTRVEEADAKQIAAGEKTMEQLSRGSRPEVVQDLADIQHRIAQSKQTGLQAQKRSIFEHQQTIFRGILSQITDPAQLVKKKLHVSSLNRRTPERAIRLAFGPKLGQQLNDILIKPIHANESAKIQAQNEIFDAIRNLGLTEIDSKLTQLVGERVPGKNGRPITLEDIKAGNITEESLPGFIDKKDRDYILGHLKEANPERIANGVDFFQKFYKSLHEVINDVRLEHGQAEIGWQENYFPHWSKDDPLTKTLKTFGLDNVGSLPTSIAGKTAWFRPNSRFVQFFEKRRGPATMYDAVYGAQLYTTAVLDMAYHIDDVMRLRNFDAAMRGKAGEIDVANAIDSIFGKKNLVIPEEDIAVMEKTLEGEYMDMEAPEDYAQVAQWVTNFTNKLANKQLFQDRGFEEVFGRAALNTANFIESQFAKNSVVGNLSSTLNNSVVLPKILATTDQKYVAQALKSRIMNPSEMKELAAKSEFLMGKKGVRNLVESPVQKAMRMVSEHTFEPVEELMSDLAFYSKYLEQVDKNGMNQSAAIEAANDYAANMMARRSKGGRPLNMESKNPFIKLFTTFQTEVSNDWYSVVQDLPEYTIQNMGGGNNAELAKKIGIGALKYCIYARALNMALEFVTGFAPAPDPLMWIWEFGTTLLGNDDDDEEKNLLGRAGDAAAGLAVDILNQVPGASTVMALAGLGEGRIPLPEIGKDNLSNVWEALKSNEEIPNREDYILDQLWRGAAKPVLSLAMPFGGNQLRKTAEGLRTFADGGMYTQSKQGKQLQVEVNNDLSTLGGWRNLISAAAFGKSAIPEVREYYDNGGKTKSIKYTEAHDAGYETSVLDQLFPTSTQSTGNVSYEKLTGGAEGAAEVDNWLNQLAESTGKDSVLPSNTTPSITAAGEKVELSGTDMMEYAQTKQETSYSILSALYPVADTIPEAAQVSYASAAQDYATAVAKEAVAGVAPAENSWIAKVQDQAGVSGTEVTDELLNVMLARAIINSTEGSKNAVGQTISGSKKRNAIQALQDAGFSGQEAVRLYNTLG